MRERVREAARETDTKRQRQTATESANERGRKDKDKRNITHRTRGMCVFMTLHKMASPCLYISVRGGNTHCLWEQLPRSACNHTKNTLRPLSRQQLQTHLHSTLNSLLIYSGRDEFDAFSVRKNKTLWC